MSEWAQGIYKLKPHLKAYLFVGDAGNALAELVDRAIADNEYVVHLRPPLKVEDLALVLGNPEDRQVFVVHDVEAAQASDWLLLDRVLTPAKTKGRSLVMVGTHLPESAEASTVRYRVAKQGVFIEARTPGGELGRKHLVEWFAEETHITVALALEVCKRVDYSLELLVWSMKAYKALSSGLELESSVARKLLSVAVPTPPVGNAFWLTMNHNPSAYQATKNLDYAETKQYLNMLESALTDLTLMVPVLDNGGTYKNVSDKTGLHIVRVIELADVAFRYTSQVIERCRQTLSLGYIYMNNKEIASTVALLWG